MPRKEYKTITVKEQTFLRFKKACDAAKKENPDVRVVVFNPDGSVKIDSQLIELTKHSKSNGKIGDKWIDWQEDYKDETL